MTITSGGEIKHFITGSSASNSITVNAPGQTVNIVLENVDISLDYYQKCAFNIEAGAVNLTLWGYNKLKSGGAFAGISNHGNPLVIQEDTTNGFTDTLTIRCNSSGAGIGGDNYCTGSNITIHSGQIEIKYAYLGACIGGGNGAAGENILIDGGTIIADANYYTGLGAGIGGGVYGQGNNIRIAGGTVTATSSSGAGIGGGKSGTASDIIIDGGSVKAYSATGNAIGGSAGAVTPKNSSGNDVYLVSKASLSDTEKSYLSSISYNIAGANAIDGAYYLYLPEYPITYNTGGGTHNNPGSYNVLSDIALADAQKTDYAFAGWFDAQTGGNKITRILPGNTGSKTLYAQWSPLPALQSITAPAPITGVASGTAKTAAALGLPNKVRLNTDQGEVEADVTWNVASSSYDPSLTAQQTFTVSGMVTLPSGVANPNNVSLQTAIDVTVDEATYILDVSKGSVIIGVGTNSGTLKVSYGASQTLDNIPVTQEITITGTTTANTVTVSSGVTANITLSGVSIDVSGRYDLCAFDMTGATVSLKLADGTYNTLMSSNNRAGLQVPNGASLTIEGPGTLWAEGRTGGAGIGGGQFGNGGIVTISEGMVTATGGNGAAGIGGGYEGNGSTVVISGGSVKATGVSPAENIGHGSGSAFSGSLKNGSGKNVYLTTVTLDGVSAETAVSALTTSLNYNYGMKDMHTDSDGRLYLYMPENTLT